MLAHQGADQRLADSAYHQRDGEMRINIIADDAVTLGCLEHERPRGELPVGEGYLDIQDFRRAAQCSDDEGAKGWP